MLVGIILFRTKWGKNGKYWRLGMVPMSTLKRKKNKIGNMLVIGNVFNDWTSKKE
jgi:hypothetical protein